MLQRLIEIAGLALDRTPGDTLSTILLNPLAVILQTPRSPTIAGQSSADKSKLGVVVRNFRNYSQVIGRVRSKLIEYEQAGAAEDF